MMTELEIFNLALGQLGIARLSALTDSTDKRVQAYQTFYSHALSFVMSELQMNFTIKIDPLSLLSNQTITGYTYAYSLPGDCIMIQSIMDSEGTVETGWELRRIGSIADTVVATNLEDAFIEYVQSVSETSVYTPQFIETLKYKLAMDMAIFLTDDSNKLIANSKLFESARIGAIGNDASQYSYVMPVTSTYTDSRG